MTEETRWERTLRISTAPVKPDAGGHSSERARCLELAAMHENDEGYEASVADQHLIAKALRAYGAATEQGGS